MVDKWSEFLHHLIEFNGSNFVDDKLEKTDNLISLWKRDLSESRSQIALNVRKKEERLADTDQKNRDKIRRLKRKNDQEADELYKKSNDESHSKC